MRYGFVRMFSFHCGNNEKLHSTLGMCLYKLNFIMQIDYIVDCDVCILWQSSSGVEKHVESKHRLDTLNVVMKFSYTCWKSILFYSLSEISIASICG